MLIKIKKESRANYPGLQNNAENIYPVLNIDIKSDGSSHEFLIKDGNYADTPVLVSSIHCEIINADIPSEWVFYKEKSGGYTLCAKEISGDFWKHFYDNEPEALTTMKDVIKKTNNFHAIKNEK